MLKGVVRGLPQESYGYSGQVDSEVCFQHPKVATKKYGKSKQHPVGDTSFVFRFLVVVIGRNFGYKHQIIRGKKDI